MRKKGVLLTIGLAFYCAGLLSIVLVFIDHTERVRGVGNDASAIEQISAVHYSIEAAARDVFEKSSGIDIAMENSTLTLFEQLPNPHSIDYATAISALESFVEKNLKPGGLTIDMVVSDSASDMSLVIEPYGINITHGDYGDGPLIITPTTINFDAYNIKLHVPETVSCASDMVPGTDFDLHIEVFGNLGTNCTESISLNASASSAYSINNGSVVVNITDFVTRVESNIDETEVEFGIGFPDFFGHEPEVYLLDTISISSNKPSITKQSKIRIA